MFVFIILPDIHLFTFSTSLFSYSIYAINEASDFKFAILLGFVNAHQKAHPEEKSGVALG